MAARVLHLVPAHETAVSEQAGGPSDEELVTRAVCGDRWAEEALYRRHARSITSAVLRLVGRDRDADDIVQETFITVFEKLPTLRDGSSFRGWAAKIALNQVRRHMRKRKILRFVGLEQREEELGFAVLAVDGTRPDLRAELAELDRILARLPVDQRMTWLLHRVEGWSIRETAAALDCSTATMKRRLAAADSAIEVSRSGRGWTV